eukprot:TRINITY_DN458_c0_g1_i3.p1 TRINITY_DN458_c0_g1~~TRINITY_DN458_c0_g1_i3.p1  ORF type:complete len:600 (+),score=170.50 TRINITY_DN458_c0_g1_i3:238-2037(+)
MKKFILLAALLVGACLAADLLTSKTTSTFDYVIIGGGGAGAMMGARFSENPRKTVIVLEQGTDSCPVCDATPFSVTTDSVNNAFGADRYSAPQLFVGRSIREIRAQLPGGGTRFYGGVTIPSSKSLIDQFYPQGVKYDTLLPYFNKLQDHFCHYIPNLGISAANCTAYHGKPGGPMSISPPSYADTSFEAINDLKRAAATLGVREEKDPFNPQIQFGSYIYDHPTFRNRADNSDANSTRTSRESTWSGYLPQSVRDARPNLKFQVDSKVVELIYQTDLPGGDFLFGGAKPKVIGVIYLKDNLRHTVFARKQVILSAGVFGNAELLQLNGIGPASLLQSKGIPVVVDNQFVGQNIAAHQATLLMFLTKIPVEFNSANGGSTIKWHLRSPSAVGAHHDMEIEMLNGYAVESLDRTQTGAGRNSFKYASRTRLNPYRNPFLSLLVENVEPEVRGSINITDNKMGVPLNFDLKWPSTMQSYNTSSDYKKIKWAYQLLRDVFKNKAFADKWVEAELIPGPPQDGDTQDYTDLLSSAYTQSSIYHITGGMDLGRATDTQGRIKGVDGITVCDNSLIPYPPNANPTTTMLALCEYVADKLKESTKF